MAPQHRMTVPPPDHLTNDTPAHYLTWHNLTQPILQWTRQHLDSFFALAEMACEWNIDPG